MSLLDLKAVANTLVANGISAVPVVTIDGSVVGIVSEGDLMRRAVSGTERKRTRWLEAFSSAEQLMAEFVKAHGRKAKDVMTRQVISVGLAFVDVTEADEVLRKVIVSNLRKLPWTGATATVDVIVDHGVVSLWGVVRNEEEKNAIRVAAEGIPGVLAVNDHLRVYS